MASTPDQLARGDFKADGSFQATLRGRARIADLVSAFVTIEGQQRWADDVRGGRWLTGPRDAPGGVRELKLTGTMWTRHQIMEATDSRIVYVFLESGGGMPISEGRVVVTIQREDEGDPPLVTLRFDMQYRLGFAFRLMKDLVTKKLEEAVKGGLRKLVS